MTIGSVVEWKPEHARGRMRATVTRIVRGRVYMRIHRSHPKQHLKSEVWFDADEVHRLTVVTP